MSLTTLTLLVDGAATGTQVYWLVLDHLGTTAPIGFHLDWSILPA